MPELPDVEGFREVLASCARGRRIQRVEVYDTGVLHGVSARRLRTELEGRSFAEPERHGKWLLARTDGGPTLLMHFGMTGRLVCPGGGDGGPSGASGADEPLHAHDRVVFTVGGDGSPARQLRYRDQRKLKGLWLADDAAVARTVESQGPDAMTVGRRDVARVLAGRRGTVKSVLTDQSALAGLGNLLADEILWRARLHPARRAADLDDGDLRRLHTEMRRTLRASVPDGQVPPKGSWLTGHRDEPDARCPRCGTRLRHDRVAGRGTVWCPHCQPEPGS